MARTATRPPRPPEDAPPLDPEAVSRAYRYYRERRRQRAQRERAQRWAAVRFWLVLAATVAVAAALAARTLGEIERLFGL
ncbi:MAG: hypothetical protein RMM28_07255 [Thermoleophilia bacterium]|nr:hypothetical protein [Gaiellaceae bacterium]MDW8338916.1 hypothetical protein [Thermoleophilia bacterium]